MRLFLYPLLAVLVPAALCAQSQFRTAAAETPIPGEVLVRFHSGESIEEVLEDLQAEFDTPVTLDRTLSKRFHIALLRFDPERLPAQPLMDAILRRPEVLSAQWNYPIEFRNTIPDDPFFDQQWSLDRIGLPAVWDITIGGLSANGDTIVIAILDSGFQPAHEDLRDNVWYNPFEIADDSIDNDGNGFVDDIIGWDFPSNSPTHRVTSHGQSVAGIAGARGNNGIGVSGVNMTVRLMLLSIGGVPDIIAAYDYVIEQRRRYNESNGAAGAFVVVTNASFGQPNVFCSQQPVWGGMYDLLGEVGVLTAGATVNSNYDVDVQGDMPSTCPSDFLLSVLNTNRDDLKHQGSGFGKNSIDLGSPGQDSYTITLNNEYNVFGGNSAAAPHLAGAIALLYSAPCPELGSEAIRNPAKIASFMRRSILRGVDRLPALKDFAASGGRLNVKNSMDIVLENCKENFAPIKLSSLSVDLSEKKAVFLYSVPSYGEDYLFRVINVLGQTIYNEKVMPQKFADNIFEVSLVNWPSGAYFAIFQKGKSVESYPFFVH
ncbi:MAG: S8 family serine peptidase [Saprospiraceae bacterium]|nr:S8 family serine peptidase [Saprospiraceae bacterium]